MKLHILETPEQLGQKAAEVAAGILRDKIAANGSARLILSTGASQFTFMQAIIGSEVDWSKVEMFHLDEYVGLPETHIASFRKYLKERFLAYVPVGTAHLVSGEGDVTANIARLSEEVNKAPIDLALIGIGENAHIAFNDPPADFDTKEVYKIVNLDESCKAQQVREGWFASNEDVPRQAVTMTVHQIMQSEVVISCVPYLVKANAIRLTLQDGISSDVPASILKTHKNWSLYLDRESASQINSEKVISE